MTGFDLLIFVTLAIFVAFGAWRGLLREAVSLLTWVLAGVLAWIYAAPVSQFFSEMIADTALRQIFAFVLIFILVFVLGLIASWFLHKSFPRRRVFRLANTALGGVMGAARGSVLLVAVFLVAGLTSFPQRDWWRESTLTPVFERAAVFAAGYIPRDIARHIRYG
ncbi:MAG TPA: CvpA family protein [Sulfuricaulis sp.]|nr:CvpA family protein [Sulfuricaulis sp.]